MAKPAKFSSIAHRFLTFGSPISGQAIDKLIPLLPLNEQSRVLDIGCGNCEVLLRILKHFGCSGVGVDINEDVLAIARKNAEQRSLSEQLSLVKEAIYDVEFQESFDLTMCIGASHCCGKYEDSLRFMKTLLKPQGLILSGEGFWRRPPNQAYLDSFGGRREELHSFYGNVELAHGIQLSAIWSHETSDEHWDDYEGKYRLAMARFLAENPDFPQYEDYMQRSKSWYDAYLAWGRSTMGFALYLFQTTHNNTKPRTTP